VDAVSPRRLLRAGRGGVGGTYAKRRNMPVNVSARPASRPPWNPAPGTAP